jgi:hypothetical protein
MNTAEGLGSCRKRKGKDAGDEAADVGGEHHGLCEKVKLITIEIMREEESNVMFRSFVFGCKS